MNSKRFKHLFGPVPSRRLGRSLGVDLIPFKTCSFDCIFCQLGRTTRKTLTRKEYVSVDKVNRPHRKIEFKKLIDGQWLFRKEFKGELWMEVFLVWGTNTTVKDVSAIAELAKAIGPDRIQLNTAVRPPCEEFAYAVPREQMERLTHLFEPPAEIAAEYSADVSAKTQANEIDVLNMLERRPCTLDQICGAFGLHRNETAKYVGKLTRTGQAQQQRKDGETYYWGTHRQGTKHANV